MLFAEETLMRILNRELLRRLAGGRAFGRGEDCWLRGRVKSITWDGEIVIADVSDADDYQSELWVEGGELKYSCTCPDNGKGAFCKHCVAVGLKLLAGGHDTHAVGKYLRYAATEIDEYSHQSKGVFIASWDLKDAQELSKSEEERLLAIRRWFNDNLPAPDDIDQKAIFWFKTSSQDCIQRIWELVNFLRGHGYFVEEIASDRPGKIVYEDRFQVGAIPFKDTKFRR